MKNKFIALVLCLFASLSLFGCSNNDSTDDKSYEDLVDDQLTTLDDFYLKPESKYFVLLHFSTCPYCQNIKDTVFEYVDTITTLNNPKIYFFNMDLKNTETGDVNRAKFKSISDLTGSTNDEKIAQANTNMKDGKVNSLANTYYFGVPALYVVENNTFSEFIVGETVATYLTNNYIKKDNSNAWIIGGTIAASVVIITSVVLLVIKYKK